MKAEEMEEIEIGTEEVGFLNEQHVDMGALSSFAASGALCDWRTRNVYYRHGVYSLERRSDLKITYDQSYVQLLFLIRGEGISSYFPAMGSGFSFRPGQFVIFFHPKHELRTVQLPECVNQEVCIVNLPVQYFFSLSRNSASMLTASELDLRQGRCAGPIRITAEILDCLSRINNLYKLSTEFRAAMLEVQIQELILLALVAHKSQRTLLQTDGRRKGEVEHKMERVAEILRLNPEGNYSLKQLAGEISTNISFLKVNFKKVYDKTIFEFLMDVRMEKARRLLKSNECSIAEIAEQIGYKHATHFTAAFKKYYGLLPKQFKSAK